MATLAQRRGEATGPNCYSLYKKTRNESYNLIVKHLSQKDAPICRAAGDACGQRRDLLPCVVRRSTSQRCANYCLETPRRCWQPSGGGRQRLGIRRQHFDCGKQLSVSGCGGPHPRHQRLSARLDKLLSSTIDLSTLCRTVTN